MNVDRLSRLPIELFIKEITYLPFEDVIRLCSVNRKLRNYCTSKEYNASWKLLIDDTFGLQVHNYGKKLDEIWKRLGVPRNTFNYRVYTRLVKLLDPITQLMIYYRQGDMEEFNNPKYEDVDKFLALILLGEANKAREYLPSNAYKPFIRLIEGERVTQEFRNLMLNEFARFGNPAGVKFLLMKGADPSSNENEALDSAIKGGYVDIVKLLLKYPNVDPSINNNLAVKIARDHGHEDIVKVLLKDRRVTL